MTLKVRKKPISIFLRNILIMLRGSFLAQIATVLGGLYLAKVFGPDHYGVYGSVVSISTIIALVLTLQLDKVIVLSNEKSLKKNWVSFLILFILVVTGLLFSFVYISGVSTDDFSNKLILLTIVLSSLLSMVWIFDALLTSVQHFRILSNTKIIVSIGIVLSQFIFFHFHRSNGLILGYMIAQLLLVIYFLFSYNNYLQNIKWNELRIGLEKHRDILFYLLPSNVVNGLGLHIMPILIFAFFDVKVAAVYFLSLKLLSMPLHLMTSSIGNVFFKRAADDSSKKSLYKTTKQIVSINVLIMFVFLIFLNTVGIQLLDYFFDSEWKNLQLFILLLSFLYLARASFNPISSLIVVKKRNHIGLLFNIYLVLVNLIAIGVGYKNQEITYTISILSCFGGIGYFFLLYYFFKLLRDAE